MKEKIVGTIYFIVICAVVLVVILFGNFIRLRYFSWIDSAANLFIVAAAVIAILGFISTLAAKAAVAMLRKLK